MRLKFFLSIILIFSLFHTKSKACATDPREDYIYWSAPPYIDPNYNPVYDSNVSAFYRTLNQYFSRAPQDEMTFTDYQSQINDLEKNKKLEPIAPQLLDYHDLGHWFCGSNTYASALNFLKAASYDPQANEGFQDLIRLRHYMLSFCGDEMKGVNLLDMIQSLDEKKVGAYKTYLEASYFFYTHDYEKSLELYEKLKNQKASSFLGLFDFLKGGSHDNWLQETAAYMEARILLVQSQKAWDGFWTPKEGEIDKEKLLHALKLFQDYLKRYPKGHYVDTSKNIQRKIFFMLNDEKQLNESMREAVNRVLTPRESGGEKPQKTTAQEFETLLEFKRYFKGEINPGVDSPMIIAFYILEKSNLSKDLLSVLEREEKRFVSYPGLYKFLRAWVLYKLGMFQEVVDMESKSFILIPNDNIGLSFEMLRVRSLRALGQSDRALDLLKIIAGQVEEDQVKYIELEMICLQFERGRKFDLLFMKPNLSLSLLADVVLEFTDEELNQLLENPNIQGDIRALLIDELMMRYVLMGKLKEALFLYEKMDEKSLKIFSILKPYMKKLIESPQDKKSLLEFGKALFEADLMGYPSSEHRVLIVEGLKERCQRCQFTQITYSFNLPLDFLKKTVPPISYFLKVIQGNKNQKSDQEAEALHYLVSKCFHGGWDRGRCTWWRDDLENKSPEWFHRLHKKYKGTVWANETPYYY
ncbi:hypothetical protein Bealeia1_01640 [Candidatus Bealeia paramacronuclearis]|uniref:Tetratricopeptide repeat protein n=1 Tax=Candidatus Bealeia paramacronuclearis TaxID=1921001 RepID=A0ABZ2C4P8_9PROT|nr:hypothetical protein [Candidatus Bealeia paramacronuclearis]